MAQEKSTLIDCVKEYLNGDDSELKFITLPLDKQGNVKIPYNEFKELVKGIDINIDFKVSNQILLKVFGDNVIFGMNDSSLRYIFASSHINNDFEYGSKIIIYNDDEANEDWKKKPIDIKRNILHEFFNGNIKKITNG